MRETVKRESSPKIAKKILSRILPYEEREALLGDFDELFQEIVKKHGYLRAWLWCWIQVLVLLPRSLWDLIRWRFIMLRNYFKIAWRSIKRHKGFSFINIAGLSVGLACGILILLWVQDELSYNKYHVNSNRLYRVLMNYGWWSPPPLAPTLKAEIPEIKDTTRFIIRSEIQVRHGDRAFYEDSFGFADPSFLKMFSFSFVHGDPATALSLPNLIVITENMARKYFGHDNPMGRVLNVENQHDLIVSGVVKNIPLNTNIRFDFLVPFMTCKKFLHFNIDMNNWRMNTFHTYLLLRENAVASEVAKKVSYLVKKHHPESEDNWTLQSIRKIYLYNMNGSAGAITYVYIFSALALIILIIVCINFMNLKTAQSASYAKTIGVRKIVGAKRKDIITQYFGETILFTFISLLLALFIAGLALPVLNEISKKELTMNHLMNFHVILGLISITLFTGIISGSYPALFLSSFRPAQVMKGVMKTGSKGKSLFLRRILVIVQFSLSVFFIICSTVLYKQLHYFRKTSIGFDKENVIYLRVKNDVYLTLNSIKNELLRHPEIQYVTASSQPPAWRCITINSNVTWEGKGPEKNPSFGIEYVAHDYFKTLKMDIVQGASFSKEINLNLTDKVIINEKAALVMGMESPVGRNIYSDNKLFTIIGMIKDYHNYSLHQGYFPLLIKYDPERLRYISVRIKPQSGNIKSVMDFIWKKWKAILPDTPFEPHFLDELIDGQYQQDEQLSTIFGYFTFIAIFLSCLGLFGLASYTAERRTKEIGIRKVLGATISRIVMILSKEFALCVTIANFVAWPVSYYVVNKYLQNFSYRIDITIWLFLLTGIVSFIIALLTVGFKSLKTARANPVDSLRHE
jgi:ABC-type antimicrobial peptide transport system permease subunit